MVLVNSLFHFNRIVVFSLSVIAFLGALNGLEASGGLGQTLQCIRSFMFISFSDTKSKV